MKYRRYISLSVKLWVLVLCYSCSVKKYIPEGEVLYTAGDVVIETETKTKDLGKVRGELQSLLRPKPNAKILGIRLGLWAHYRAQREKPGFLSKFLNKKIGEAPVYLSNVDQVRTQELIDNRLENRGFFRNTITSKEKKNTKTATVRYTARVNEPYVLATYQLDTVSLALYSDIQKDLKATILQPGMRYDLAKLKAERERIDSRLKAKGYYNFNADFLIFEADTNRYDTKKFDLFLRLKKDVPKKSKVPYTLNSVKVFPNYSVDTDSIPMDTVLFLGKQFIQDKEFFKPKRLEPYLLLEQGDTYSPQNSKLTSNRLASIGAYKFVNIRYKELDTIANTDSIGKLDAHIYLSPLKKRALRAELQAVSKSNNFAGPTLSLTYSNRNLFKGGETLNITGSVGYETQLASGVTAGLSSTQISLKTDLIFPRLLFPIPLVDRFEYAVPKTKISLGGEYLNRGMLYSLSSITASFGYSWNENRYVFHELNPLSLNYVDLTNTTPEFDEILAENPFLNSSFQQQFIAGLTYSFTYNELGNNTKTNALYFNANLDVAGNALSLFSTSENDEGKSTFLGLEFAQYAKLDMDIRYHIGLGKEQKIVGRLFAGVGLPYGNSDALPFAKQFFSGGPYSVRAFRIRSLGPGTFNPNVNDNSAFFDSSGDIRLEANLEYRFPVYSFLKGALFVDAGNIWLSEANDALPAESFSSNPGGRFTSEFLNELAMGVGAGLRFDIQNFVIRFDLAAPIRKPFLPEGERFDFDLGSPVFNFAIGYPF